MTTLQIALTRLKEEIGLCSEMAYYSTFVCIYYMLYLFTYFQVFALHRLGNNNYYIIVCVEGLLYEFRLQKMSSF